MREGFDGGFIHSQPVGFSLGRKAEAILLFAAGYLRLERLSLGIGTPQEGVPGSTGFVLSHEHGVVVVCAFIENLRPDAGFYYLTADPPFHEVGEHPAIVCRCRRQGEFFFLFRLGRRRDVAGAFFTESQHRVHKLYPFHLDKIIKGAGKQKTSTIHLNLFPAEANEISNIFMEFTDNVHKQMGFIGKDIPTFESLEANGAEITSLTFTASGIGLTMDEIPKFLSTHDFYLYAKVKGLDVDVPIDKVTNAVISKPVDGEVRIRDRCFFPAYRVVYENGNSIIRIGKGISVALKAEENRITVHTDRLDTLSDFIIEADFFIELVEQGELTLNGVTIPLNGASLSDLQERKKILEYCKDVKKMLDYLGVTEELLLNDLSENDEKNLRNFTGAVLYNRKIGFPTIEQDQFYGAFKIANLVIWIWAKRQSDGMYNIDSFFKLHQITLFAEDDVDFKRPVQASQFVLFDKKGLVHISNMDYERVYSGITQTPHSPEYCTKVNFLVLDMIGAYDEQAKHDEKLLNLAEKICDWLKSIESVIDPEVLLLNKLQITKRRRTLSTSEIIELAKLTENSYPPATRCGAYLLMDADEEAQKCFDELPLIAQEEFLKYPICHFGKLTMKEDKPNG